MKKRCINLTWLDLLILTGILFGSAIYQSSILYLQLSQNHTDIETLTTFSSSDNYGALFSQSIYLFIAIIYLWIRGFDFATLGQHIRINRWVIPQAVMIFLLAALGMDLFYLLLYPDTVGSTPVPFPFSAFKEPSLILYALFNGFYEEIFFLGLCLTLRSQNLKWAFLYSLLIRFSFHTYQGLETAIGLGFLLGALLFLLYTKWLRPKNLLPFFLAHSLADIIGLSFLFSVV
ncbi:hypothetical protein B9T19_02850 [Ignatzschineria sp. F8392]|uniref:CPBP family glutamic-type intramembrane protease n=1 Tax=Ignatzschineria sp. F8392 TaxID=1980117 RepID=UPI000B97D479|nr:CPBP family glutamic-type intramembrane protease [Ignatzschineria sp. F8392]OYQ81621.1 hypothetical protein B9T19_02850 [Ignatzschineria sp. F8392]